MLGLHINSISPVLRLGSLRDLNLFEYDNGRLDLDKPPCSWNCPPKFSSIDIIRLDDCSFHFNSLQSLVSSCQALKTFALTIPRFRSPPADWFKLGSLLKIFQPELEALAVKEQCVRTRLGSLRALHSLKYLAAPLELMIGKQTLRIPRPSAHSH